MRFGVSRQGAKGAKKSGNVRFSRDPRVVQDEAMILLCVLCASARENRRPKCLRYHVQVNPQNLSVAAVHACARDALT